MVGIPRLKGYFRCYFLALSVFFFQEPSLVKSSALFLPLLVSSAFAATPGPVYPNESRTAITLVAPRQEPCGVRIEGTFPVGPTSTGAGVLKVTNLGQKPIAALRGATRFYFSGSEAQEVTWGSLTVGVRHIRTGFIAPGKSTDVPSGGMRYSGKGGIYRAEGYAVGVVYSDGSTCGAEGSTAKSMYLSDVAKRKEYVDILRKTADQIPQTDFQARLRASSFIPAAQKTVIHIQMDQLLQMILMDQNKINVASDFRARLDQMSTNLGAAFPD